MTCISKPVSGPDIHSEITCNVHYLFWAIHVCFNSNVEIHPRAKVQSQPYALTVAHAQSADKVKSSNQYIMPSYRTIVLLYFVWYYRVTQSGVNSDTHRRIVKVNADTDSADIEKQTLIPKNRRGGNESSHEFD